MSDNKNVPTGSETLKNRRAGLKESAVDYVNSLKKSLTGLKDSKQPRREIEKPKFYTGHDQNCIIPFSQSRIEVRDDLIRQNKFFNYEDSVKNQLIESSDFAMGIFEYMKWREERFEMQPYFGSTGKIKQTGFTPSDRKRLIDWMVEFQEIQESTHETLYLAIRLCDYFFGHKQVSRKELQLVAFVGFLLAAKFEERWPPLFEDMIRVVMC